MLDAGDLNGEREVLGEKLLLLNEKICRMVNDNASMELDPDEYQHECDTLTDAYRTAMDRIQEIDGDLSSQ